MGFNGGTSFGSALADGTTLTKTGNTFSIKDGYLAGRIKQIYTGSGFDTSGTGSNAVEMDALTSADLVGATYVKVTINYTTDIKSGTAGAEGSATLLIEEKETGGAYNEALNHYVEYKTGLNNERNFSMRSISYLHTLDAGDLANGHQFRITGTGVVSGAESAQSNIDNVQTIVEVI